MKRFLISVALLYACAALAAEDMCHELMKSVAAYDEAADAAVAAIRTPAELAAKQKEWRAAWLESLGGLPERTPLEDRTTGVIQCEGYRIEKVVFQSQPGVYVTGLLYLPADPAFKAPYPGLLVVHGHSNEGCPSVPRLKSPSGMFSISVNHLNSGGMNSPNGTRWCLW